MAAREFRTLGLAPPLEVVVLEARPAPANPLTTTTSLPLSSSPPSLRLVVVLPLHKIGLFSVPSLSISAKCHSAFIAAPSGQKITSAKAAKAEQTRPRSPRGRAHLFWSRLFFII